MHSKFPGSPIARLRGFSQWVPRNLLPKHKQAANGAMLLFALVFTKRKGKGSLSFCEGGWSGEEICEKYSVIKSSWNAFEHLCSSGNIRNTEKLSYDKQHQYEILVTAYDCGQKPAAQDTLVQVDVKPVCKPGWQGGPVLSVLCEGSMVWCIESAVLVLKSSQHTTFLSVVTLLWEIR